MRLLQDMLSNLMRGTMGLSAFGRKHVSDLSSEPQQAVKAVLSATGEVSSLVYAENLLNVIEALDDAELAALLAHLLDTHDINAPALATAATNYANAPTHGGIEIIANAAEPGWMELFRRLNATTNGTVRLVHFRQRLLDLMRNHPDFRVLMRALSGFCATGSTLDFLFWNQSTGRPLQISWKKSSPMRRSMKSLHGTICARALHLRIGAVSLSFILPCPMSR